jgi:hypothetical protein
MTKANFTSNRQCSVCGAFTIEGVRELHFMDDYDAADGDSSAGFIERSATDETCDLLPSGD